MCDGGELDINEFEDAFDAIGYGWGGGGNTFRKPDMRGYFIRGVDISAGNDPDADDRIEVHPGGNTGDKVGSLQADQMQCFSATYDKYFHQSESVRQATAGSTKRVARDSDQYNETDIEFVESDCGEPRFGDETRPKNVYVNYIIKIGCPPPIV